MEQTNKNALTGLDEDNDSDESVIRVARRGTPDLGTRVEDTRSGDTGGGQQMVTRGRLARIRQRKASHYLRRYIIFTQ